MWKLWRARVVILLKMMICVNVCEYTKCPNIIIIVRLLEWWSTDKTRRKHPTPRTCIDVGKCVSQTSVEQTRGKQSSVEFVQNLAGRRTYG